MNEFTQSTIDELEDLEEAIEHELPDLSQEIDVELRKNNIYVDDIYMNQNGQLEITIMDGDWKHEHIACHTIVSEYVYAHSNMKVGNISSSEIGHSDSDCYSARHIYSFEEKVTPDESAIDPFMQLKLIED